MKRSYITDVFGKFGRAIENCQRTFYRYIATRKLLDKQQRMRLVAAMVRRTVSYNRYVVSR